MAGLVGGALGLLVGGAAGGLMGNLYLFLFMGPDCCGLEGILPVLIGTLIGVATGIVTGAVLGTKLALSDEEGDPPLFRVLLLMWPAFALVAAGVGKILGFDDEDPPKVIFFLVIGMATPWLWWVLGTGRGSGKSPGGAG
jgi:hypothetical protein